MEGEPYFTMYILKLGYKLSLPKAVTSETREALHFPLPGLASVTP